jgi:ElaA protein
MELYWQWYTLEEFSVQEIYAILALRQQVFVVEQKCPYLDCDGLDQGAWHLVGWQQTEKHRRPLAYLRVILPKNEGEIPAIGRLLTHKEIRGKGIGGTLLTQALQRIKNFMPGSSIRISAQYYLLGFYEDFGFSPVSKIYVEDGIPHIAMIHTAHER